MIEARIEDIHDPLLEKNIDTLISEPLGIFLFNEQILKTYVIARDKFLKPNGKLFPSEAQFCIAPFYDEQLYKFQLGKTLFWTNTSFYGINLTALKNKAIDEKLRQPIIETYNHKTQ